MADAEATELQGDGVALGGRHTEQEEEEEEEEEERRGEKTETGSSFSSLQEKEIAEQRVADKTNEIPCVAPLLENLDIHCGDRQRHASRGGSADPQVRRHAVARAASRRAPRRRRKARRLAFPLWHQRVLRASLRSSSSLGARRSASRSLR